MHSRVLFTFKILQGQLSAPKFPDLFPPQKPLFKIVLTLGGNVNGNKVQN